MLILFPRATEFQIYSIDFVFVCFFCLLRNFSELDVGKLKLRNKLIVCLLSFSNLAVEKNITDCG